MYNQNILTKGEVMILGAGISGLAAAISSGLPIYEAENRPGGLCSSYYIAGYRFEIGGGHWIFGADDSILSFIRRFAHPREYMRHSSVYFNKENLFVSYPIQNNLRLLNKNIACKVLKEISNCTNNSPSTMAAWLLDHFGPTLCKLFFFPFHALYTANLYTKITPQDVYKTPVDVALIKKGAKIGTLSAGYNARFVYPKEGLNTLVQHMAKECDIHYRKRAIRIDIRKKNVHFADGSIISYSRLISTLPLSKMIEIAGINLDEEPDPHTSVLVLNIGAARGNNCPDEHWLYSPKSDSGFYRIGCYSNVDTAFLPPSLQKSNNNVSIYVERAYPGGQKPSEREIKSYSDSVIRELQKLGFIKDVEVIDPTWIDVAYTWCWAGSTWREKAIALLKKNNIYQIGRYGRWKFQGIAESIKEGLGCTGSYLN